MGRKPKSTITPDDPSAHEHGGIGETRDPLDRHYTPDKLARWCLDRLFDVKPDELERRLNIIEPSVGGGAFARAIRSHPTGALYSRTITGYDLDPNAAGFGDCDAHLVGDWTKARPLEHPRVNLVVGNPPFSGYTPAPHLEKAFEFQRHYGSTIALILPMAIVCGPSRWLPFVTGENTPEFIIPVGVRPWPKNVREVGLYVWTEANRKAQSPTKILHMGSWE